MRLPLLSRTFIFTYGSAGNLGFIHFIQSLLSIGWHVRSNLIEEENVYKKLNKLQELEDALRETGETGVTGDTG